DDGACVVSVSEHAPRRQPERHSSSVVPRPEVMNPTLPLPAPKSEPTRRLRAASTPLPRRVRLRRRWVLGGLGLILLVVRGVIVAREMRTPELQPRELTRIAREVTFPLAAGPSQAIRFPTGGPFDERLGYTRLPDFIARLSAAGFEVTEQARHSD